MSTDKIFCYNCCHFDEINFCKTRRQFVKPKKGKYCQDFVDKTGILKPTEEIPQPVKPLEEIIVAPVKTQLELTTEKIKRVSLIRKILNWLIRRLKCLLRMK